MNKTTKPTHPARPTSKAEARELLRAMAAKRVPPDATDEFLAGAGTPAWDETAGSTLPSIVLATAMIRVTMTKRDLSRLANPAGLAVVVSVPGPDYVIPVARALGQLGAWGLSIKRSGSSRATDRPDQGGDAVHDALGAGYNVFGVSQAPARYLPAALVDTADIRVDLPIPGARVLREAIRHVAPGRIGSIPEDAALGLPFDTLAACLRPGNPRRTVERVIAASQGRRRTEPGLADVPPLEAAIGYGEEAVAWGKSVITAVARAREVGIGATIEATRIVLAGPAGVGKTIFARSLAKSTKLPLHVASVGQWFSNGNGYLGDVIKAIDSTFTQATSCGPAILLLDELDAIPSRATVDNRHRDFWVAIISHVLTILDGAVSSNTSDLIIIGTTNFPERLDEALVRPGRLSRIVRIGLPTVPEIAGIFRQHLGSALPTVDLASIAAITNGCTGAEIAGWVRSARQLALDARRPMQAADLLVQVAPPETRDVRTLTQTARHEAAHAIAIERLRVGTVSTVSIVQQGNFAGRTMSRLLETSSLTAAQLDATIVAVLAGRAADEAWGAPTTGSAGGTGSDLAAATAYVAAKIGSWGLGGSLAYRGDRSASLDLVRQDSDFRIRVETELDRLYCEAVRFVAAHASVIDRLACHLVEARVLSGDVVRQIAGTATIAEGQTALMDPPPWP